MSRSPQKILMTIDAVGGVWTYALQLCKALPSIDFMLACMGPAPTFDKRSEVAEIENAELVEGDFKLEWSDDPWSDIESAGAWLLELEETFQPDLIHLNGYVHGSLPWLVPVVIVGHSCVVSWWDAVKGGRLPERFDRYSTAVSRGLHSCDCVIVPSRAMGDSLVKNYGIAPPLVISNGCEACDPTDVAKEPIIFCAARLWDDGKNVSILAKAAADLSWPLVIAGLAGDGAEELTNVTAVGHCKRQEMDRWYQRASIYAHPALYEPFGLAVLEAAYFNCALVLADIPSLREIWHDAAEFVEPHNPLAWKSMLDELISDPEERLHLAVLAKKRSDSYSAHLMSTSYLNVYQGLLMEAPTTQIKTL